jgi:hypothetical protein
MACIPRFGLPLVAALVVLSGCAVGSRESLPTPTAHPDTAITVTHERGGRFLSFVGPKEQHDAPFLGVPGTNVSVLRSFLDTRSGEVANQLYVEDSYSGPERGWNAARDANGKDLRFIAIGKDEITCSGGCSYAEEFAAALPESLLRASPNGLTVYFYAKSGATKTIAVSAARIAEQLAALDSARAGLRAAEAKQ